MHQTPHSMNLFSNGLEVVQHYARAQLEQNMELQGHPRILKKRLAQKTTTTFRNFWMTLETLVPWKSHMLQWLRHLRRVAIPAGVLSISAARATDVAASPTRSKGLEAVTTPGPANHPTSHLMAADFARPLSMAQISFT